VTFPPVSAIEARRRLVSRVAEAASRSDALRQHAARLGEANRTVRIEAGRRRLASADDRQRRAARQAATGEVVLEGVIDGRVVAAHWRAGDLSGDPELLERARIVVTLGDRWTLDSEDGADALDADPVVVLASLAGPPVAVALTLMRACGSVRHVRWSPTSSPG